MFAKRVQDALSMGHHVSSNGGKLRFKTVFWNIWVGLVSHRSSMDEKAVLAAHQKRRRLVSKVVRVWSGLVAEVQCKYSGQCVYKDN
jgi:hypothetical protein